MLVPGNMYAGKFGAAGGPIQHPTPGGTVVSNPSPYEVQSDAYTCPENPLYPAASGFISKFVNGRCIYYKSQVSSAPINVGTAKDFLGQIMDNVQAHPIVAVGAVGVVAYFLTRKKGR